MVSREEIGKRGIQLKSRIEFVLLFPVPTRLDPLRQDKTRQVRKKLAALRIAESDIADAVAWARKAKR